MPAVGIFNYSLRNVQVTSNLVNVSVISKPAKMPFSSKPVDVSVTSKPANKPVSSKPVDVSVTSKPANKPVSSKPVDVSVTSKPANKPVSSKPVDVSVTSKPANKPISSKPVDVSVTSKPANKPISSKPVDVSVTSKPDANVWFSHCAWSFRHSHLISGEISMYARTGNLLFNMFCVLALSRDYCYTAVLTNELLKLEQYFDIKNVEKNNIIGTNFMVLQETPGTCRIFKPSLYKALDTHKNWTIQGYRQSYKFFQHQEKFVKFSVNFKTDITKRVTLYLQTQNFTTTQLCTIHVRGTDKLEKGSFASWYKPFIDKAMEYVSKKITGVKFIFVSDDIERCKTVFQSSEAHFSPFRNPGEDLALMSMASHAILTDGTFGWMGAWLGNKGTEAAIVYRGHNDDFFPPNWISL